jgi:hypothetical protein
MKNSVLMRSINTQFRQKNSLILKLTSGQRKIKLLPFNCDFKIDLCNS